MRRAQASVTAIEAGIGVLLVLTLAFTFALATPSDPNPTAQAQLDAYADDAATILSQEQPRHAEQTRLAEITGSAETFEREAAALEARVDEILPANVLFRVETEYGAVGHRLPANVQTGTTTVPTTNGDVTIKVWFA